MLLPSPLVSQLILQLCPFDSAQLLANPLKVWAQRWDIDPNN